jgi:ribosomal protein S24E
VIFEIEEIATPRMAEVRREIAVLLRVDVDQVWVRRMKTKTGTHTTLGLAHVYDDITKARKVEPKYIINRNKKSIEQKDEEAESE